MFFYFHIIVGDQFLIGTLNLSLGLHYYPNVGGLKHISLPLLTLKVPRTMHGTLRLKIVRFHLIPQVN